MREIFLGSMYFLICLLIALTALSAVMLGYAIYGIGFFILAAILTWNFPKVKIGD